MSATLFLAALVVAQPLHVWEPVKFAPAQGTKLNYASTSNTSFEGMGQTFSTKVTQSSSHEATGLVDGWTQVKITVLEQKVESDMPFGEMPDPTGMATTVLVSSARKQKDMKVVSNGKLTTEQVDVLKGSAKNDMESGFEGLILPEGNLTVGQTWSLEHAPAGAGMAGMPTSTTGKVKTTYKVLSIENGNVMIEAVTAGNYTMNIESPQGTIGLNNKMNETRKYTVRASDGVLLKAETTSEVTMSSDFGDFTTKSVSTTELKK